MMLKGPYLAGAAALGLAACGSVDQSPSTQRYSVEVDYMLQCQGCHLPNGEGFPEKQVPSLAGEMGKLLKVEGGRAYLVQVPGAASSDLSDEQLADVLNWMLQTFSAEHLPHNFKPYEAEEVAQLRAQPLLETRAVRAGLIEKVRHWEENRDNSEAIDEQY